MKRSEFIKRLKEIASEDKDPNIILSLLDGYNSEPCIEVSKDGESIYITGNEDEL
jgi:hypothetical protein